MKVHFYACLGTNYNGKKQENGTWILLPVTIPEIADKGNEENALYRSLVLPNREKEEVKESSFAFLPSDYVVKITALQLKQHAL